MPCSVVRFKNLSACFYGEWPVEGKERGRKASLVAVRNEEKEVGRTKMIP